MGLYSESKCNVIILSAESSLYLSPELSWPVWPDNAAVLPYHTAKTVQALIWVRDKRNQSTLVWCTCGMLRGQEVCWIMIVSSMYWLNTRLLSEQFHSLNLSSCQENSLYYREMMMWATIPHDRHTMRHKSTGNAVQCECTTVQCVLQCNSMPQPCCVMQAIQ